MTDTELIKAVAERLGWKKPKRRGRLWVDPSGCYRKLPYYIKVLPASVDAALAVVINDGPQGMDYIELAFQGNWKVHMSCGLETGNSINESFSRAILEAFLATPKEKP